MALLTLHKNDRSSVIALWLIASAVPVFAVSSFEGTVHISTGRWLALYLIGGEAAVVVLALFSGWQPIQDWRGLPANVRIALSLWSVVVCIATGYSSDVAYSGTFQAFWIVHFLFAWALWSMLKTRWRAIQVALPVYLSIGLLLHSLGVYFVAWAVLGPNLEEWERYSFGTTNPRLYIFYASVLLGLGLGFLVAARDRVVWLLAIILTFAAYHLFAWSGGRASFGTSLVMPFLLAALAKKWKRILLV